MKTLYIISLICLTLSMKGQNTAVDTQALDKLISLKQNMIKNHEIKTFYTIQLFSGKRSNAEEAKRNFDAKGYKHRATIEYETPNYKVWVGEFRTKLFADKAFFELKNDYPNALILRPGN